MHNSLPAYAERLDALHRALADNFRQIVGQLPLAGDEIIVDVGCGDGFFTDLLSERLPSGEAIGLDNTLPYLTAAKKRLEQPIAEARVRLVEGDANCLPFQNASIDAIWTGHSMQSYSDLPHVLREFYRVLRPGGLLAVLETDNIHSIMLSWPPDLELAVRQAEHREIGSEDSYVGTYFPRFAKRMLGDAGFENFTRQYVLIHRQQSADDALERFVELYLNSILEKTSERLSDEMRTRLAELADRGARQFLPRQENFFFGSLQVLMTARAPAK